jgi:hypothetical protein
MYKSGEKTIIAIPNVGIESEIFRIEKDCVVYNDSKIV